MIHGADVVTGVDGIVNTTEFSSRYNGISSYSYDSTFSSWRPTSGVTLEAWAKPNALFGSQTFLSCFHGGGFTMRHATTVGGRFQAFVRSDGANHLVVAPLETITDLSIAHHFAFTFDGQFVKLYIDGELMDTNDMGSSGNAISYVTNASAMIGADPDSGSSPTGFYFGGVLSDIAIYGYALTSSQIKQHCACGRNRQPFEYEKEPGAGYQWSTAWVKESVRTVYNVQTHCSGRTDLDFEECCTEFDDVHWEHTWIATGTIQKIEDGSPVDCRTETIATATISSDYESQAAHTGVGIGLPVNGTSFYIKYRDWGPADTGDEPESVRVQNGASNTYSETTSDESVCANGGEFNSIVVSNYNLGLQTAMDNWEAAQQLKYG